MRISFGELRIGDTAKRYLQRAIDRNWVSEGENVREFEQKFAEKFGYKHAIATSSGTDADICSCASLYEFGAQRGDEIIVPALCFVACANSILAAGFIPRFVDIDIETLNLDPKKIEDAITKKTRAIMMVYNMGKVYPIEDVVQIAQLHNLRVIEDSCEAHGGKYNGKLVGTFGDMATFSFYAAHIIVAGEGGMIVTNNDEIAKVARSVRTHGRPLGSVYFDFQRIGFNSRMNELTAAIGLEGLEKFDETFDRRRKNLRHLLDRLQDSGVARYCHLIKDEPLEVVSPHAFPLVLRNPILNRERLYSFLESKGIQCKTLFGSLPTQHKAFKFLGYKLGDFPVAEYVGDNGLHFGIHQYLTEDDIEYVAQCLAEYFRD